MHICQGSHWNVEENLGWGWSAAVSHTWSPLWLWKSHLPPMAPLGAAGTARALLAPLSPAPGGALGDAQVCLGWPCTHPECTCTPPARPLHTHSCRTAELPVCSTNTTVFGTAAALGPWNAPSHTAHPAQIVSEHLSETLSKSAGKRNHRSHAKSLEYWIYSLLPALNESSNHNGFWTPSLSTRMQKIKQFLLIHKAISHLIKSKLDSWSNL